MTIPPLVWMYWESVDDRPRPPYLEWCEQSILRHADGLTVQRLSARSAREAFPSLPGRFESLSPVHQSDLVRAEALLRHGGVWVDADTVAMRPLTDFIRRVSGHEFVAFPDEDGAHIAVLAAVPGSEVARLWVDAQRDQLRRSTDLGWSQVGSDTLMPALLAGGGVMLPIELVAPVEWRNWRLFLSVAYPLEEVISGYPFFVSFFNAFMGRMLKDVPHQQIQRSQRLYARALRYSLNGEVPRLEPVREAALPLTALVARATRSVAFRSKALVSRVSP